MNGIRLETLMAAHEALMRVWNIGYAAPVPPSLQNECMSVAVGLKHELGKLGLQIEVKAEPKADEPLRAVA